MAKKKKPSYDLKVALIKTGKNMLVMFVAPALLYLLAEVPKVVPEDCLPWAIPVASCVSYLLKNYLENK